MGVAILVVVVLLALLFIVVVSMTIKIVPQARAGIVERFGKYRATLSAGLNVVVPFVDKVRYMIDLREQVVSFPPQPVITEDNLTVSIDTVIYFQVTDPVAATYEIAHYIQAIEQLTMTTLRNIIGGMTLEHALTSRDQINSGLRGELDGATGKWGIRVNRVELKGIDPPPSIADAMEKQMRAERDKRAAILTAEGERQSAILSAEGAKQASILNAEGEKQSQILYAEGEKQAAILRAQGEGRAIETVFQAIHDGNPDQKLLSYQYLQMLPEIAKGENASTWIIPAEITKALGTLGGVVGDIPVDGGGSRRRVDLDAPVESESSDAGTQAAVEQALQAAKAAEKPGVSTEPADLPTTDDAGTDDPPAPQA
ncbi:MAG: SPFH/Band 7/PHB domain protein [Aeromicrobium erythreum]